jgi:hypothetical protein
VSIAVEATLQPAEDDAAPVLRDLVRRWPLNRDDRATLAQFMAIHAVRTPAWLDQYRAVSMEAIDEELRRRRWEPHVAKAAVRRFVGDDLRVETMLKQIPRVASVLMSMHWTLVQFPEPILASCDQPMVFVPHLPQWRQQRITALPSTGFMDTAEARFPVDPWRLLLLSWSPRPDLEAPVSGEHRHATNVNRSTREQADEHWFHRPGLRPPLLTPPMMSLSCTPISYDLVPEYSLEVAATSRRRAETDAIMQQMIESHTIDQMRFVVVTPKSETAR